MKETGLKDIMGNNIRVGQIVHWTDGGDDLTLEERIATRWDRIAIVGMEGILPKFTVIDSPSESYRDKCYYPHTFCYGNFIYKDTEKYLTIVANSKQEYRNNFNNAGECMEYVLTLRTTP